MNTILVTGKVNAFTYPKEDKNTLIYDVAIWGCLSGEDIQVITYRKIETSCYGGLWDAAKDIASLYFKDESFRDGGYTRFLDHIDLY